MHAVKSMGRRFEREKENMTELPDVEEAIMLRFPDSTAFPAGKRLLDFSLETLETDRLLAKDIRLTMTPRARSPYNCGMFSYNGNFMLNICRFPQESGLEKIFTEKLDTVLKGGE